MSIIHRFMHRPGAMMRIKVLVILIVTLLCIGSMNVSGADASTAVSPVNVPVVSSPVQTSVVSSDLTLASSGDVSTSEVQAQATNSASSTVTVVSGGPAFMSGWSYRKIHAIGGSPDGDLTDYQMRFVVWRTDGTDSGENVYVGSNVREDYGDLRFTTIVGAQMPYWIESVGANSAVVWVKVPAIPRAGTQVVMYYGNPGVSSASNGKSTFEVFDDFESGSLDTSLWSNTAGYTVTTVNGKGVLQKITSTGHGSTAYLYTPYSGSDGSVVISTLNSNTLNRRGGPLFRASDGQSPTYYADPANSAYLALTTNGVFNGVIASGSSYDIPTEGWYRSELKKVSSRYSGAVTRDGTIYSSTSATSPVSPSTVGIHFADQFSSIDYFFVRNAASTEPVHGTWSGAEEAHIPPSPDFSGSPTSGLSGMTVQFTDLTSGTVTGWDWDFGDGSTHGTVQNPSHTYNTAGTYSVTLTSTNAYGSDSVTKTSYITVVESPDFISGYSYRKQHIVTSGGNSTLTDYQVRFHVWRSTGEDNGENVYVGTSAKEDYSDIRFTDVTGTVLPYWIESSDASSAYVWVQVPEIAPSGTYVYVYYGNPSASSASNGKSTFEVFDDFESGSLDTSLWSNTAGYTVTTVNGKGVLQKITSTGHGSTAYLYTPYSGSDGSVVISTLNSNTLNRRGGPLFRASDGQSPTYYADPANSAYLALTTNGVFNGVIASGSSYDIPTEGWYRSELKKVSSRYSGAVTRDGTIYSSTSATSPVSPSTVGIHFADQFSSIDYFFVRNAASTEPVHGTWSGAEEAHIPPSPDFSGSPTSGLSGMTVQFTDLTSGTVTGWDWDFGDGSTHGTVQNPSHTYNTAGTYSVTLTSTNAYGSDSVTKTSYITVVESPDFISGYSYRKQHIVTSGGNSTLTDYQVRFHVWRSTGEDNGENVYVGTSAKEDYSDIRFTDVTGTVLPYWIESSDASSAYVWVQVPEIAPSGTYVYVYYGNPSASSASNGKSTFEVFDDFESGSLDTSLWSNTAGYTVTTVNGKGVLQKITSTGHGSTAYLYTPYSGSDGSVVISTLNSNTLNRRGGPLFRASDGQSPTYYADPANSADLALTTNGVFNGVIASGSSYDIPTEGWYRSELKKVSSRYSGAVTRDGTIYSSTSATSPVSPSTVGIHFADQFSSIDYFFVRNAASTEPVHGTWSGAEEAHIPPSPDFSGSPTSGLSGMTVQFTDLTSGTVTGWDWDFGDGSTHGTVQNPSHTYNTAGTYSVTLTSTNAYGSDSVTKTSYITVVESPDFISGYSYRKQHIVTSGGNSTLTDYQVRFHVWRSTGEDNGENVYVGTSAKEDYSDIRFTDVTGTVLPYWIESSDASSAYVWVQVPEIAPSGTYVYVYYGNPSASSASNGKSTFEVFDDFESGSLDTSLWSNTAGYTVTTVNGKGVLQKITSTGHGSTAYLYTPYSGSDGSVVISTLNSNTLNRRGGPLFRASDGQSPTYYADPANSADLALTTNGVFNGVIASGSSYDIPTEGWYRSELKKVSSRYSGAVTRDGTIYSSTSATSLVSPSTVGIHFADQFSSIDYFFVRNAASTEPVHGTWSGAEEAHIPPSPDFSGSPTSGLSGMTVQFTDLTSGTVTGWDWDFGDGSTHGTVQNPSHTYNTAGTYSVTLTSTNAYGSDSVTKTSYITVVESPDFISGYSYRKQHIVTSGGNSTLTDYQVRFHVWRSTGEDNGENVYVGTSAKEDYSDIRFTDVTGTVLPYWIESSDASSAYVWVQVPEIAPSGTYVYVYYGNPSASSASNGKSTFEVFDDFESGSLDTSLWSNTAGYTVTTVNGKGVLQKITSTGHGSTAYLYTPYSGSDGSVVISTLNSNTLNRRGGPLFRASDGQSPTYYADPANSADLALTTNGVFNGVIASGSSYDIPTEGWYRSELKKVSSRYSGAVTRDGTIYSSTSATSPVSPSTVGIHFADQFSSIDYFFVRNAASTEPVHGTWSGAEEAHIPPSPDFSGSPTSGLSGMTVQFTDLTSGTVTGWDWDFGDGSTHGTVQNPSHTYNTAGTYSVTLTSTNAYGSDSVTKTSYITVVESPDFISGYSYRKQHIVTSGGNSTLTDYQVRFHVWRSTGEDNGENVYVGTSAKEDYSDIRFTDVTGTVLPYWIESSDASSAYVWVQVPEIAPSGTYVYVYYGNPSASSASNGKSTFEVFDDFESGSLDTSLWSNTAGYTVTTVNGKGVLQKITSTGHGSTAYLYTPYSGSDGSVVISTLNSNTLNRRGGPLFRASDGQSPTYYADPANSADLALTTNGVFNGVIASGSSYDIPTEGWYRSELKKVSSRYSGAVTRDGTIYSSTSATSLVSPSTVGIHFADQFSSIDYFFVRNTASTEPIHGTWSGAEKY